MRLPNSTISNSKKKYEEFQEQSRPRNWKQDSDYYAPSSPFFSKARNVYVLESLRWKSHSTFNDWQLSKIKRDRSELINRLRRTTASNGVRIDLESNMNPSSKQLFFCDEFL